MERERHFKIYCVMREQHSEVKLRAKWCKAVHCSAVQCSTVQCSTVEHSNIETVFCGERLHYRTARYGTAQFTQHNTLVYTTA
jgi:hypothetical protein